MYAVHADYAFVAILRRGQPSWKMMSCHRVVGLASLLHRVAGRGCIMSTSKLLVTTPSCHHGRAVLNSTGTKPKLSSSMHGAAEARRPRCRPVGHHNAARGVDRPSRHRIGVPSIESVADRCSHVVTKVDVHELDRVPSSTTRSTSVQGTMKRGDHHDAVCADNYQANEMPPVRDAR
ncbi:hypothetical protein E2562_005197 [Oryza meyeriana var. granulata]|uniref:Uncharacterized protein n=1 Tax=Oryza meyeriana var. granulata TaxID=110450 RepID=A0A6G1BTH5_9ORYZ|nr:hypothetical protein E2562_005197 [Oryza meyeriana var. granulata]